MEGRVSIALCVGERALISFAFAFGKILQNRADQRSGVLVVRGTISSNCLSPLYLNRPRGLLQMAELLESMYNEARRSGFTQVEVDKLGPSWVRTRSGFE